MPKKFHAYRFRYNGGPYELNLGVMLIEIDRADDGAFADLSFRKDLNRLGLGRQDIEYLSAMEADIRSMLHSHRLENIDSEKPTSRRDWIISQISNNFSNTVMVLDPIEVCTDSPNAELKRLMLSYMGTGEST